MTSDQEFNLGMAGLMAAGVQYLAFSEWKDNVPYPTALKRSVSKNPAIASLCFFFSLLSVVGWAKGK